MLDDNLFKNDVDKKASFPQSSTATKMHEIGEHDEVFELEGDQIEKYADLEKIQELVLATVNLRFCFYLTWILGFKLIAIKLYYAPERRWVIEIGCLIKRVLRREGAW